MTRKIGIQCLLCNSFIKFWNPSYFASEEEAGEFFNLRKIEIVCEDKVIGGYICYRCYSRLFKK
ncbi:MAG: hypothetical protein QW818_01900 [Candidatus Aenigmatarchaeota archaeon]|nr:hypothetical protein [Candidatus Aenigmarchaeota archaeon]